MLQKTSGASEPTLQDGALYADQDIIDLTMIPPPMTPDEVSDTVIPDQVSDTMTLDQVNDLTPPPPPRMFVDIRDPFGILGTIMLVSYISQSLSRAADVAFVTLVCLVRLCNVSAS